ncbi:hypothetical protein [Corynebacterium aurimucosum]|uniref:hypothetical protein n=1 Tax=Corynebacterium aurimucosum TaxID=169292 RepID=UPI000668BF73|nr:hypothetical protein [Corynebacterium aurimucosum]
MRVYFIDTSVLDNLLAIPHKCQAKEQAKIDFAERQSENAKFILPITAVIETGNHIAQLPQGDVRRNIAEKVFPDARADRPSTSPMDPA